MSTTVKYMEDTDIRKRCAPGQKGHDHVVEASQRVGEWWMNTRQTKLIGRNKETINVNPFLLPMVMAYHGLDSVEDLGELLLGSHLVGGHFTGFGKMIDEKLLPHVFGTQKFDAKYRNSTPPYSHSAFNDIDHSVYRDGYTDLLSLKASPWTINLGGAKDLNASFAQINEYYMEPNPGVYGEVAVGVLYGQEQDLTDKYTILRGADPVKNAKHHLRNVSKAVHVYAGREFWSWLNFGEHDTQDWVLEGLIRAAEKVTDKDRQQAHIHKLIRESKAFEGLALSDGSPDWQAVLRRVNG
ncbi:restriction endonuclease [Corynebacterium aurimucosum]|nr:restriction endonuclease [Corynebacterium guaraldiae]